MGQTTRSAQTSAGPTSVLDPNLPLLASHAAIEIDCMLQNRGFGVTAFCQLADLLKALLESGERPTPEATTMAVLGGALVELQGHAPADSLDQMVKRAIEIAHIDPCQGETGTLQAAKQFCLALSRSASAHRLASRPVIPPHPSRR